MDEFKRLKMLNEGMHGPLLKKRALDPDHHYLVTMLAKT